MQISFLLLFSTIYPMTASLPPSLSSASTPTPLVSNKSSEVPDTCVNKTELFHYGEGHGLEKVYDTLVSCQNVEALHLDFFRFGGCVHTGKPWAFEFLEGDKLADIKTLSL